MQPSTVCSCTEDVTCQKRIVRSTEAFGRVREGICVKKETSKEDVKGRDFVKLEEKSLGMLLFIIFTAICHDLQL